jgi:formylglycine-generating enzyme required for sulfatase activity
MNPEFVAILKKLAAEHGKEALLDAEKCKAFLSEYTHGEFEKESRLLLQLLNDDIQEEANIENIIPILDFQRRIILDEERYLLENTITEVADALVMVLKKDGSSTEIKMVRIDGGTFTMGSPADDPGRNDDELQHQVTVSSFCMGKYEVTYKEYKEVMGKMLRDDEEYNPLPKQLSWYWAVEYCNRLSRQEGLSPAYTIDKARNDPNYLADKWSAIHRWTVTLNPNANGYRLPTEAEWEYAARGGNGSPGNYIYSGSNKVGDVAWYNRNSGKTVHPVGTKAPNRLGLYDMSGNVWEWCWDWYGDYTSDAQTDPTGAATGSYRVIRGGAGNSDGRSARSASRGYGSPDSSDFAAGIRLVRPCD